MDAIINNTKNLINFLVKNYIKKVNCAVDMTVGNGYDSKMILDNLNPEKLYCFDIQKNAIENTNKLLENYSNYILILDNHTNFLNYVKEKIDFAIYNLGYLPNGDKTITTNALDVEESLSKLLENLNEKAIVLITFYIGHNSGLVESEKIGNFLKKLNQKEFTVLEFNFKNQKNNPPYVVMIQRV